MLRPVYIKRFLSGLLLVVFALGITPKKLVHDMFAKHTDMKPQKSNNAPNQLANAGYNCDNNNLVAETNFVHDQQILSVPVFTFISVNIFHPVSFSSVPGIYSSLRGPPVNI